MKEIIKSFTQEVEKLGLNVEKSNLLNNVYVKVYDENLGSYVNVYSLRFRKDDLVVLSYIRRRHLIGDDKFKELTKIVNNYMLKIRNN